MIKKSLKIVQILPDLNSGGVEKGTLEIAKAIVEAGHKSIVISSGGRLVKELEQEGSEHITWDLGKKSPLTFLQSRKLRVWLRENNVDIIHARSRLPAWVAWLALIKLPESVRPHFITTVHGLNSVSRYSKIMTAGDQVIAVSNTVKDYLLKHYPSVSEDKIQVIHRGVDPDEFPFGYQPSVLWFNDWYQSFPETREKWLLTLPGRLTRLKGHHDFIEIIHQLKQKIPNLHGLIVGGEDPKRKRYAEELYQKVKELDLQDDITFTGYRTDMKEIYAHSDVILSLSTKPESFGRTTVEAISLGKPVVAYNHGGVGETLGELFPEGLVSLCDISGVVECCAELYEGNKSPPNKGQVMYLKKEMLERTIGLYNKVNIK